MKLADSTTSRNTWGGWEGGRWGGQVFKTDYDLCVDVLYRMGL